MTICLTKLFWKRKEKQFIIKYTFGYLFLQINYPGINNVNVFRWTLLFCEPAQKLTAYNSENGLTITKYVNTLWSSNYRIHEISKSKLYHILQKYLRYISWDNPWQSNTSTVVTYQSQGSTPPWGRSSPPSASVGGGWSFGGPLGSLIWMFDPVPCTSTEHLSHWTTPPCSK